MMWRNFLFSTFKILIIFHFFSSFGLSFFVHGSESKPFIKGLNPKEAKLLRYSSTEFTCKDGSKIIPFKQVNDDYCDCEDSSDEPGTSACPDGHFWCENKEYKGIQIFSSHVGDGICDCCDGSDEANGLCPNKCTELASVEKEKFAKTLEMHRLGIEMKQQYIFDAERELKEKRELLEKKKQELEELQKKKQAAEEIKKQKEEQEKIEREKLEAEKKENEEKLKQEQEQSQEQTQSQASTQDPEVEQLKKSQELELKQDQGWNLEQERVDDEGDEASNDEVKNELVPAPEKTNEDDITKLLQPLIEGASPAVQSFLIFLYSPIFRIYRFFAGGPTVTKESSRKTQKARKEFDELDHKVRNLENEIRDLEKILSLDFGEQNEFYYLSGKCFSAETVEYTYELCPFDKVNQKPKLGSPTSLGTWNSESQTEEWTKQHKVMLYTNGQKCWGGPDRSTKVELFCGSDNIVQDPQEPNKCEYSLKFYTPAVCNEHHLKQLEKNLELGRIFENSEVEEII